jgi:hypothetical protein
MGTRRKLALGVAALAALLLVALAAGARFWNLDRLRDRIVAEVAAQSGGEARIGRLRLSLLPLPRVVLEKLSLSLPNAAKVEASSATIHPRILSLLRGQVRLSRIRLSGVDVALAAARRGASGAAPPSPSGASPLSGLRAFVASQAPGITLVADQARLTTAPAAAPSMWVESADGVRLRLAAEEEGGELRIGLDSDVRSLALRRGEEKFVLAGVHLGGNLHMREETLAVDIAQTRLDDPHVALSGQLTIDPPAGAVSLNVEGKDLEVSRLLAALHFLTDGAAPVRDIADVLRGGVVPEITASAKGESLADLASLAAFRIAGRLQDGRVRSPATRIDLEGASGDVTIEAGVLTASNVAARFGKSSVRDAGVRVGLTDEEETLRIESRDAHILLDEIYSRAEEAGSLPDFLRRLTGITGSADLTRLRIDGPRGAPSQLGLLVEGTVGDLQVDALPQLGDWPLRAPLSLSQLRLERTRERVSASGRAVAGDAAADFDLAYTPGRFELSRLEVHDPSSDFTLRCVTASDALELGFSGQLVKETLDALLTTNPLLAGSIRGAFEARLSPATPLDSTAKGKLEAADLTIPGPRPFRVAKLSLQAEGSRFVFDGAAASDATGDVKLAGTIESTPDALVADATLNGGDVDLGALLIDPKSGEEHAGEWTSRWRRFLRGKVDVRLGSLRYGRFRWQPFHADVTLAADGPALTVREARLCGLNATGTAKLLPSGTRADATLSARNEPVEQTLACLTGREHAMTGTADLDADLQAEGEASQVPRSARGSLRFEARQGRVHEVEFIAKALTTLNVATGGIRSAADLRREGLPYDRLSLSGAVSGGKLQVSEGVLEGPTVKMTARGSIDLIDGALDVTLLVAPLRAVDSVVGKVPVVGSVLGGTIVTLPVGVSGTVGEPKITPLEPSAVGNELKGLMNRTLRLPRSAVRRLVPGKRSK